MKYFFILYLDKSKKICYTYTTNTVPNEKRTEKSEVNYG